MMKARMTFSGTQTSKFDVVMINVPCTMTPDSTANPNYIP